MVVSVRNLDPCLNPCTYLGMSLDQPLCLSVPTGKMMELEWVPHGVLFHLPRPERWMKQV